MCFTNLILVRVNIEINTLQQNFQSLNLAA